MNFLVLGMNYAPESTGIAPFTTGLCEFLVARGHAVTVATTFPHYPEWSTHAAYAGKWTHAETRNGVLLKRKKVFLPKQATTWRRVLYDTSLSVGTFFSGWTIHKPDLILGVLPPIQAGAAARLLARRYNVPYVLWIQDLALEAAMSVGMMRDSFALRSARQLEQWAYAGAEKILVISEGFQETLARNGVAESKLAYLPNWASADFFSFGASNGFRHSYGIADDALVVMHAGNMGVKQDLENVLHAAHELRTHKEIEFIFVGDGSQKNGLMQYAQQTQLSNVRFLPLVPSDQVPAMMAAADILLLNQHPDMVEAVIPSKLLSYMAAARPIVIAAHPDSEASRQVHAAECGVWVDAHQPAALAQAVTQLARDADLRQRLGQHGRAFAEKNFARETLLCEYEKLLASVIH